MASAAVRSNARPVPVAIAFQRATGFTSYTVSSMAPYDSRRRGWVKCFLKTQRGLAPVARINVAIGQPG